MEHPVLRRWREACTQAEASQSRHRRRSNDLAFSGQSLITKASKGELILGSGNDIYSSILPTIEKAEDEIILVTCFWSRSSTLDRLNVSLRNLSSHAVARGKTIQVRICFSSLSLIQKLFHTRSLEGHVWPPSTWSKRFGLPGQQDLAGLDLEIKSIFILPFSVMHPKFIIVDRRIVFLPSCNISWENWFEGCIELTGPITEQFIQFWSHFWASAKDRRTYQRTSVRNDERREECEALFLPSPHHALSLFDGVGRPISPQTPLNTFILSSLERSRQNVYLQTPNLTSTVVLNGIVSALQRGISFEIVTSEKLMILEQLITARTTTSRCIRWLVKKHAALIREDHQALVDEDLEASSGRRIGHLSISYYQPRKGREETDPVQTHLKLMIIDNEVVVLGSGNLDRASWVTSQELGVAFFDPELAAKIKQKLKTSLAGRLHSVV